MSFQYLPISSNMLQGLWRAWQREQHVQPRKSSMTGSREKNNDCFQKENKLSNTIPPAPRNLATVKWKNNSQVAKTCSPRPHTQVASIPKFGTVGWRLLLNSRMTSQPRTAKLDLQFPKVLLFPCSDGSVCFYIFYSQEILREHQRPALPCGQFCPGMLCMRVESQKKQQRGPWQCCKERKQQHDSWMK